MKPPTLADRILVELGAGSYTSRELAKKLNASLGNVPPTLTKMHLDGKVKVAGTTRYGRSRAVSIIWEKA